VRGGGCRIVRADQPRERVANGFIAIILAIVGVREWAKAVMDSPLESVRVQRVSNLLPSLKDVFFLEEDFWDGAGGVARGFDLVPVRECDILAAGDPPKSILEAE
jgi:hypothetical protein